MMSSSLHGALLIRYSLSPLRKRRRVTVISLNSRYFSGTSPRSFQKESETSAIPMGGCFSEPLKITSSMALPRRWRADCSPITHRIASTTFDLPQPFGPTIPVTPSSNWKTVRAMKLLKPVMSRRLMRIRPPRDQHLPYT